MSQSFKSAYGEVKSVLEPEDLKKILAGVSGGADSLALAAVLAKICDKSLVEVRFLIIDHQIQKGSGKIAAKAKEELEKFLRQDIKNGELFEIEVAKVEVDPKSKLGLEGEARKVRHELFQKKINDDKFDGCFLAHTLDDQAETVFLGLMRGSGTKSLKGMSQKNNQIYRPFIKSITRKDTEKICEDFNLEFHIDKMESARGFLREKFFPQLKAQFGQDYKSNLVQSAEIFREDDEVLTQLTSELKTQQFKNNSLKISALSKQPPALRKRLYLQILYELVDKPKKSETEFTSKHLEAIDQLIINYHGQKTLDLPKIKISRSKDLLQFKVT